MNVDCLGLTKRFSEKRFFVFSVDRGSLCNKDKNFLTLNLTIFINLSRD